MVSHLGRVDIHFVAAAAPTFCPKGGGTFQILANPTTMVSLYFTIPYLVQLGLRLELGAAPSALVRPRVRAAAIFTISLLVAHLRPKGGPQVA